MPVLRREHEGSFLQGISGDLGFFVAGGDQEADDRYAARGSRVVQGSVGFVGEVRVEEEGGVEPDQARDEDGVVELDCAAEARGWVDPGVWWWLGLGRRRWGFGGLFLHRGSMVG